MRKQGKRVPGLKWVIAAFVLAGCRGAGEEVPSSPEARLSLKEGQVLGPACAGEQNACPEGLQCASFNLGSGPELRCVQSPQICDLFQCSSGQCLVMESYPLQIRCSGS
ncbi:hypothetical protein A176_006915 [Myxococcus hansupus]|uniref:Lipoprotein n=1 Tax=Pseudomyxococcus hansupus TaxID=1297742 RepID=A0A0H4X7W9_9BACT|nr:hypothetical protein [Myxococcus hansupus]AKQ70003.1 hypothetical protein A176_006915 [Myxococcus hansupus]